MSYGINHKTAPLDIREQCCFDTKHTALALEQLCKRPAVNEAVILSTCHRTEIYCRTEHKHAVPEWLSAHFNTDLSAYSYQHEGIDTVRHVMRVASGLDSMVLGEPQILGQLKNAYRLACEVGTTGEQLNQLFPAVFSTSKQVRTQTNIGKNPVSLAYAVTQLAKRIFNHLNACTVLFIGAGEMTELIATHFHHEGIQRAYFANRTLERAEQLALPLSGEALRMADIPTILHDVDIIISATASQLPIIGKGMIETTLKHRKHRPLFMADLAVPRDIEPEVNQLDDVYLYNIDDLKDILSQNRQNRAAAAAEAEAIIELQAQHFIHQLRILNAGDMISRYRQQLLSHRDIALEKAHQQLAQGKDPHAVLCAFARSLTNKCLHQPTLKIREAAYHDQLDRLVLIKELLEL